MSGLGDSFDYQAKINEFKAINPNDWRIPILQQLREEKIQTKKQNTYADQMNDLKLKTDQYNYNELTDPNSITNQLNQMKLDAQKLEYTNAQLDNQIKQVQADFTLSPQYKQSLLDDLSYKKRSNELNLQKIQADITASNALANQRNSGDSATVKKSAYFDSSDKAVSETIANLEENPNIMVTDDKGNIVKDWLRTKGSQQWNQLINQIANLPISNEEKDFLLSKNRIPLP
jgi:hypothetical protein